MKPDVDGRPRGIARGARRSAEWRDEGLEWSRCGDDASDLHEARIAAVIRRLSECGARSVLDLGCGDGKLIERLAEMPAFERIVGIDISVDALAAARLRLGLEHGAAQARIDLHHASFTEEEREFRGFDAAVLLETIEHIEPDRLSLLERAVFGGLRPGQVLVTTPNQEYNPLLSLSPGSLRHPDHRFEWTRARFRRWAAGVAERNGYGVVFEDIGDPDPVLGASTQMACFARAGG